MTKVKVVIRTQGGLATEAILPEKMWFQREGSNEIELWLLREGDSIVVKEEL